MIYLGNENGRAPPTFYTMPLGGEKPNFIVQMPKMHTGERS